MANGDMSYLDADFDASKLTKPQLRSLLGEHGVQDLPPAAAKKEVLLGLFETKVRARAGEIRRAKGAVRASGKGIAFLDDQSRHSPLQSPRSARRASGSPSKSRGSSPTRWSRQASPMRPGDLPITIELTEEPRPRGRAKAAPAEELKKRGRSKTTRSKSRKPKKPSGGEDRPASADPRTGLWEASPAEHTDSPRSATAKLQQRLGFIASANRMALAQESIVAPVYAEAKLSRSASLLSSVGVPKPRFISSLGSLLAAVAKFGVLFLLTICMAVYLRWRYVFPFPYCDKGAAPPPFFPEVDLVTSIRGYCLPCPEHGQCRRGQLVCDDGHIRTKSWFSLQETCQPDWKRFSKAEDLVKQLKQVLRERQGDFQCRIVSTPSMDEATLKQTLRSARFRSAPWYGPDFESYYKLALLDLQKDTEHHGIKILGDDSRRVLLSSVAKLSYRCQLYLLTTSFVQLYRWYILASLALLGLAAYLYVKIRSARWERQKVDELCQTCLQCLAEQDALNRRDPTRPSTLSVPQLRDALFMNATSADKLTLWPKVCKAIANNSNVRESVMSIKGEQHRVWEWIGMDCLAPFTKAGTPPVSS